jgi:hypothetical protein
MPTPILPQIPQRIADEVAAAMPDLASCEPHSGRFDLRELQALGARAPAVRVGVLGLGRAAEKGGPIWEHEVQLAAYVVTQDRAGLDRAAAALAIVERLVELVHAAPWIGDDMGPPEGVSADNLYGAGARAQGVALWAVVWRQAVQIGARPAHAGALPADWYVGGLEADGAPVLLDPGAGA